MNIPQLDSFIETITKLTALTATMLAVGTSIWQLSAPAILRRREKWLREAIEVETKPARQHLLQQEHAGASAKIMGSVVVSGWRTIGWPVIYGLYIGAMIPLVFASIFSNEWWVLLGGILLAVFIVCFTTKLAIRSLCERYRIVREYETGTFEIQEKRLDVWSLALGGMPGEYVRAVLAAAAIVALGSGVTLCFLGQPTWGVISAFAGLFAVWALIVEINDYAKRRSHIYGPWPAGK